MRISIAIKLFLGFLVIVFLNISYMVIVLKFSDLNTIAHILKKQDWVQQSFLRIQAQHDNRRRSKAIFRQLKNEETLQKMREKSRSIDALLDSVLVQLDSVRRLDSTISTQSTYDQRLSALTVQVRGSVAKYNRDYALAIEDLAQAPPTTPASVLAVRQQAALNAAIERIDTSMGLALSAAMDMVDEQTRSRIKDVENRTNNARQVTLFIVIGISAFAMIFALAFSSQITRRLRKLRDSARFIGKGNFYFDPSGYSKDEIGDLATAFFDMALDLKKTQEELVKSKRLAAIGEVVASVNHEINNPLMIISGNAQFLEMSMQDYPDDIKERVRTILSETDRISVVTRKLREIKNPVVEDYTSSGEQMINLDKSSREA